MVSEGAVIEGFFQTLPLVVSPQTLMKVDPCCKACSQHLALRELNSEPAHSRIILSPYPQSHEANIDPKTIPSTHLPVKPLLLGDAGLPLLSFPPVRVEAAWHSTGSDLYGGKLLQFLKNQL